MSHSWWHWGKFLYSVPLGITGLIYIFRPQGTVESLVSFIPGGLGLIYVGGALWLLLGLALAFDIKTKWAAYGVISLLCIYLIMVYVPAAYAGEHLNIVWFELLRSLSLMGGAFFIVAVEGHAEDHAKHSRDHHYSSNQV